MIPSCRDTQLALRILARIQQHGIDDPITGHALAFMFGINIRQVQHIVEELRDAGHKVGSSMAAPMGYFIAKRPEELLDTVEHYRSRAKEFCIRANRLLDFGSLAPTIFEQPVDGEAVETP